MTRETASKPESRPLRILLVSPRTRGERYSGEDAWTDSLLASPPPGVDYCHFEDLIARGEARRSRVIPRILGLSSRWLDGPIWLETVATEVPFDLVHVHAFSARLGGGLARRRTPILLSESSLDLENLVDYSDWSRAAVIRFARRKRTLLRVLGAYDQTLNLRDARGLLLWSRWALRLHQDWGVPEAKMTVVTPCVTEAPTVGNPQDSGVAPHFLFVGSEFHRKNGPLLVAAFRSIRRRLPPASRLTIVGARDEDWNFPDEGIVQHRQIARERIFSELYPSANIFALPSRAEGYGVAVVEAMSAGLPCIVSDHGVLPEIVGDTGIVVPLAENTEMAASPVDGERQKPGVDRLADAMLRLASDPALRRSLGQRARARYVALWSPVATGQALATAYQSAVRGRPALSGAEIPT